MQRLRLAATVAVVAIVAVGCARTPQPLLDDGATRAVTSIHPASSESAIPEPSSLLIQELTAAWRPVPLALDESRTAIVSDACAIAAREQLGDDEADLPTALVDARGEGLATVVLADDLLAIVCLARTDGLSATVEDVASLSPTAVGTVEEDRISVASVVNEDDRDDGRTVAFGRIGVGAVQAKLGLDDGSEVIASSGDGWWAAWWPGSGQATVITAIDDKGVVIASVPAPGGEVEARTGPAAWWLDPKAAEPTVTSRTITALVLEEGCASGRTAEGRVEPPTIELTDTSVVVTFTVRQQPGGQDCQGHGPTPALIQLPEALGNRTLYDGGEIPPRRAGDPPSG